MAVNSELTAAILAGGKSRRMGQHKALLNDGNSTFISGLINCLNEITCHILIAGEPETDLYTDLGARVLPDCIEDGGPLAGVLSALQASKTPYVFVCPCDTPSLPVELVSGMLNQLLERGSDLVFCEENGRVHPLFAILRVELANALSTYLTAGGRKVLCWMEAQQHSRYEVSGSSFSCVNINTPSDYREWLSTHRGSL